MKIAAFDSGTGGLTAIAPLMRAVPGLEVVYLGDLANLPYGTKSPERIQGLMRANIEWLLKQDRFDWLVIACNTASAHAMDVVRAEARKHGIAVEGVLDPSARRAASLAKSRIVILATGATVSSEAYPASLRNCGFKGEIEQKACPLFVPLVEEGLIAGGAVEEIARRYLDPVLRPGDTVILGCTHYPMLLETLARLYPQVSWVDAGSSLLAEGHARPGTGSSKLRMLFTDRTNDDSRVRAVLNQIGLDSTPWTVELVEPLV